MSGTRLIIDKFANITDNSVVGLRAPYLRVGGNRQDCPTRSHAVWEMVMNELDRREDPTIDEDLAGCAMVDSCSNILSGDQFYNFLTHNFYRHFDQNRAPL